MTLLLTSLMAVLALVSCFYAIRVNSKRVELMRHIAVLEAFIASLHDGK